MKKIYFILFLSTVWHIDAQEKNVFQLGDFLNQIKKEHPIAQQAQLIIKRAEAHLLGTKGLVDPKISGEINQKDYEDKTYYQKIGGAFKIPTWYGVEFKGAFNKASGTYLNPENNLPTAGQYQLGVSIPVGKNLFINERRTQFKQAKLLVNQSKEENQLALSKLYAEALSAYINWYTAYQKYQLNESFVKAAEIRFKGIKERVLLGDKASIDSVEAKILIQNRILAREQSLLDFNQKRIQLSNYLWVNAIPLELKANQIPQKDIAPSIENAFELINQDENFTIENHPKIKVLNLKSRQLKLDRKLAFNQLILPDLRLDYNILQSPNAFPNLPEWNNYKAGLSLNIPIFLRKERGKLKMSKIKLADNEWEQKRMQWQIENEINQIRTARQSLMAQENQLFAIVSNYKILLAGEKRKFEAGTSSLFLVNSREQKLIESQIKFIETENKKLKSAKDLIKALAIGL